MTTLFCLGRKSRDTRSAIEVRILDQCLTVGIDTCRLKLSLTEIITTLNQMVLSSTISTNLWLNHVCSVWPLESSGGVPNEVWFQQSEALGCKRRNVASRPAHCWQVNNTNLLKCTFTEKNIGGIRVQVLRADLRWTNNFQEIPAWPPPAPHHQESTIIQIDSIIINRVALGNINWSVSVNGLV